MDSPIKVPGPLAAVSGPDVPAGVVHCDAVLSL
jgi:hypothetical protein